MANQMDLSDQKAPPKGKNGGQATDQAEPAPPASAPEVTTEPAAIVPVTAEGEPSRVLSAFASEATFEIAQRMAKALASSSLLPDTFRNNVPNCMIAMELANRIGCSVFMLAQNMDVIHGRPSLRAKFLISTVNASGRFTPIRFRWQGKEGTDDWGCRAVAVERATGQECLGPLITIALAKAEGWYAKAGSKWKTMPEKMAMYRAGAWWSDLYCPEFGMGMATDEEVIDTVGQTLSDMPVALRPGSPQALESTLMNGESYDRTIGEMAQ